MNVRSLSRVVGAALLTATLAYSSTPLLQVPPSASPDGEKTNEQLQKAG
jgi:hypothetical protein